MTAMDDAWLTRYSRHILLDEIGIDGQQKLTQARVAVVGVGGLGSVAALYLAAAGVGELVLCDEDEVDLTNLQRQILYDSDCIGRDKTQCAQARLQKVNPQCSVVARRLRVDDGNIGGIIADADVVVDASDNYATRHTVNRACVAAKKNLVFGAAIRFDGQVMVFNFSAQPSPCYNCVFNEADKAPDVRCSLMGVFSPLVGIIGCIQAAETIKCLVMPQHNLTSRLLLADARDMRFREVQIMPDAKCGVCGAAQ